ncbi:hypothetical protein [Aquisalinus flavus]|uniref:Uncharacterized protein n=1 Tax=Aquisalinus flavus TaxID=1526572 RepID=A0A8J2V0V7_9PROT|nr:hypothetical protein [Aquisalinus flavus]MBD0426724.1 hypothetical protein [Aquisalinus flavus]GGC95473.1 hypothetical protein GCM10011342_00340 [Aquisalinus flavus]
MTYKGRFTYLPGTTEMAQHNAGLSFVLDGGFGPMRLNREAKAEQAAPREPVLQHAFAK